MLDLGITTYLFMILNFVLLVFGITRIIIAFAFTITSVFIFAHVKDISFTPLISETMFIGLNEIAMFILGILAGFKNNIRLMYTFQFIMALLILSKVMSICESIKDREIVDEDLQLSLESMMNDVRSNDKSGVRSHVAGIQSFFHCCGFNSTDFWFLNNGPKSDLDKSCCPSKDTTCDLENSWSDGCSEFLRVPDILFMIHYYTLYPVCEVILFLLGIVLIAFIKHTARFTIA